MDDARRRLATVALVAYLLLLAWGLLAPTPDAPSALVAWMSETAADTGLPAALTDPSRMEFLANVLVIVPVPVLVGLAEVGRTAAWDWRDWTSWAFVGSTAVETTQALLLPARSATHVDIVANTAGGLLGALAVALLRRWLVRGGRDFDRGERRWLR
ncbi:VanZ family protein [Nocardioides sp. SYSU DS0663]|uniref:VanZ family protein n=1 Tax=Nocardioides sp. SYSU DS0663 TaxID=3416445 RepID=UPI003F4B013F